MCLNQSTRFSSFHIEHIEPYHTGAETREEEPSCSLRQVCRLKMLSSHLRETLAHQALMDMNEDQERIDLFEKTAEACEWPQPHWPVRIILLLSGEAQVAAQQLTRIQNSQPPSTKT